jgi:tetratricopeptide (TPR) repeat protein
MPFGGAQGLRVTVVAIVLLAAAMRGAAQDRARVNFSDVAPIISARCAGCHRPGQIGPFSLLTYDDVKRRATMIASVTARRIMPPWKPAPGKGDFADTRRLTDAELDLIQRWIADGAPQGTPSQASPPITGEWQLGRPDVIVSMPAPYVVAGESGDVFRTFVVPIPTDRARYVRAIEFRPDNARVVHHANVGIDRTRSSRQLDARDPEPGYAGGMVQDARYPEGQLLGWTPGQAPHPVAPGLQWRLEPGSDLVMQLHLQPTGKSEQLIVKVGFYFVDDPPTRSAVGLRLGSETIDIPAGEREYVVRDDYTLPVDVDVIAIQPHAHNLARRMEATAFAPDGASVPLIEIDDWDFRWQDVYRYRTPIALAKGTVIRMRYVYDNSSDNPRNPHRPPARVVWGQNTSNEMGDLWIQVVPRNPSEFATLNQDFRRKANAEDLAAYRRLLEAEPDNPLRHDAVASLAFEAGRVDEAIEQYVQSLRLNPSSASSHYNLGIAYSARGRRDQALAHFEQAVRLDPDYAQAHNNLGAILYLMGRGAEALEHYRRAVALRPDSVEARTNVAALLSAGGALAEARDEYRAALALRSDYPQALAGLAWILATAPDASLRNGDEAVTFAERAARATVRRDLSVLDALAAAYASVGRFDEAVAVATGAMESAKSAGQSEIAARFGERADLYRQHRPYRTVGRR